VREPPGTAGGEVLQPQRARHLPVLRVLAQERPERQHPGQQLHREQRRDDGHVPDRRPRLLWRHRQRQPHGADRLDHARHPRERVAVVVRRRHAQVRRHLRRRGPVPVREPRELEARPVAAELVPERHAAGVTPAESLAVRQVLRRQLGHQRPLVRRRGAGATGEGDEVHPHELVVVAPAAVVFLGRAGVRQAAVAVARRADAARAVGADGDADPAAGAGAPDGAELLHDLPHHEPRPGLGHQAVEAQVAVVVQREPTHPVGGALVGRDELRAAELEPAVGGEVEQSVAAAADVGVHLGIVELQRGGVDEPVAAVVGLERCGEVAFRYGLPRHQRVGGLGEARPGGGGVD